jgi:hypothetical protein
MNLFKLLLRSCLRGYFKLGVKRKNGAQNRSVDIHEGNWGESVIFPKPHEDSSIEAMNKFAEEISFKSQPYFF